MGEKDSFISCMKIRGVSILPPLITPARRKELLDYKTRALLLEETYRRKRLQGSSSESDSLKNVESIQTIIDSESYQTLSTGNVLEEVAVKYVPYETQLKEKPNLSIDITNAYECIPFQVPLDGDESESRFNTIIRSKSQNCTNKLFENGISQKLEDSSRPRLIRSNSYTLDNPSSILLDHLKRQSSSSCDQTFTSDKDAESLRLNPHKHIESNPLEWDMENLQDVSSSYNTNNRNIIGRYCSNSQPSLEVITTDITVQQINFTTPDINNDDETKTSSAHEIKDQISPVEEDDLSSTTDPEIELHAILQQIPENYAKKIMELIKVQKKEQIRRTQNYDSIRTEMLQSGDFSNEESIQVSSPKRIFVTCAPNPKSNIEGEKVIESLIKKKTGRSESVNSHCTTMEKSVASSLNESQTLPLEMSTSSSNSLDDFSLRTIRLLDLEHESPGDNIKCPNRMNLLFSKEMISSQDMLMTKHDAEKLKEREMQRMREEKAASIIGAYAKGYLVRRLMNTAKVKTIIQTIQEALVCALELQRSETIEEADVELHRRLIKLVSSACFDFHDIFFALTIPEQMDIIAIDREKVKRTMEVRTTISSTDFHPRRRTPPNIRSSRSLTKI